MRVTRFGPAAGQVPRRTPLRSCTRPSTPRCPRTSTTTGSRRARPPSPRRGNTALADAADRVRRGQLRGGADLGAPGRRGRRVRSSPTRSSTSACRSCACRTRRRPTRRSTPVLARKPEGYLCRRGDDRQGGGRGAPRRPGAAADLYEKLSTHKSVAPEDVLSRLARASLAAGDRKRAAEAFQRVYYEFPLTDAASNARDALGSLQDFVVRNTQRDLGRALILFGAKRYSEARSALQDLQRQVTGDDREVVDLRIAESDYFLKRYAAARDGVQPYLDQASRKAEARFFHLSALRGLGLHDQAVALTRALVDRLSRQQLGGGSAEQPRHPLHRHQPGRPGGADVQGAVRQVSQRAARGALRVEVRLVGLHDRQLRRDRARVREGGGDVPAIRLPSALSLLGRARAGKDGRARDRARAHAPRPHRLPELVLRPAGRAGGSPRPGPRPPRRPARPDSRSPCRCARRLPRPLAEPPPTAPFIRQPARGRVCTTMG